MATRGIVTVCTIGAMHVIFAPSVHGQPQFYPMPKSDWDTAEAISWMVGVLELVTGNIGVHVFRTGPNSYTFQFGNRNPMTDATEDELVDVLGGAIEISLAVKMRADGN